MHRLVLLGLALLLSACGVNRVRSIEPLFTKRDAAAVRLRPGVWAAPEAGCVFDPATSMKSWPGCATARRVEGDELNRRVRGDGMIVESRLAGGDPLILQTHVEAGAEAAERLPYEYQAIRIRERDARGRVVAYERWSVQCGPARDEVADPADDAPAPAPRELPPGVVDDPERGCLASDAHAVRRAATMTLERGWDQPARGYWVRPFRFRDHFGRPPREPAP